MKKNVIEIWVGIFVTLGILAIVFLALNVANIVGGNHASATYTVNANFTNIGGLKVKAPVKTAGVVVGRVDQIVLDKDYKAQVTIRLDKQYMFSTDASAQIITSGILGEQYIALNQGAEEENLKEGDEITLTSSAFVLEELIGKLMTSILEKNAQPDNGDTEIK